MNLVQAQCLSWISLVLFLFTLGGICVGTFFELKRSALHLTAYIAFGACGLMNLTCATIYFWQHFQR